MNNCLGLEDGKSPIERLSITNNALNNAKILIGELFDADQGLLMPILKIIKDERFVTLC